jgi:adenine-specific DNA-methyltransferase
MMAEAWSLPTSLADSRGDLLERIDRYRSDASRQLDGAYRAEMGQFLTPPATARFMASFFTPQAEAVRLLDAGAGVGSLTAAFVEAACGWGAPPASIAVVAYEVDSTLAEYLRAGMVLCQTACEQAGIRFTADVREQDFIEAGTSQLDGGLFGALPDRFNYAILNPPYRKINTDSDTRHFLRRIGMETSNLYTGFLAVVMGLLEPQGQLVAITPRSFCNGLYFRPFRERLLQTMSLRRIHVFDERNQAFREDSVLQENIVFHAVKEPHGRAPTMITSSSGPDDDWVTERKVAADELVRPHDPERFIHIVADDLGQHVTTRMAGLRASLRDLGIEVSTGRVVDFRATEFLRADPSADTVPLIYPTHLRGGSIVWPKSDAKKCNALLLTQRSRELVVPPGIYVLVKRFSAKEERRRVVAAVYDSRRVSPDPVGFENHLNYYHQSGKGLSEAFARGLAAFLNSTLVDLYFRQFNGHTQVNATDLRSLKYPTRDELEALGHVVGDTLPDQMVLDQYVEAELFPMADGGGVDPIRAKQRIDEARGILKDLGMPRGQQNVRSALTLLALLDLQADAPWSEARAPLRGITQMMDFMADSYGKRYAPKSRETVRRQTVHQLLAAGLFLLNPDDPTRPINSGKTVYQVEPDALEVLRSYGTPEWERRLRTYLSSMETLAQRYAQERESVRIPVLLPSGVTLSLSPGGQNILVEQIIHEFCARFTPGAAVIYVGDTDTKNAYFDAELLAQLGVSFDPHGKMPDVVVYHQEKNWLVLIEAVTSHGPVNPKRREELKALFKGSTAELMFVTAFLTRRAMMRYLDDISWETDVWVADAPSHLIHFDSERFLGPNPGLTS